MPRAAGPTGPDRRSPSGSGLRFPAGYAGVLCGAIRSRETAVLPLQYLRGRARVGLPLFARPAAAARGGAKARRRARRGAGHPAGKQLELRGPAVRRRVRLREPVGPRLSRVARAIGDRGPSRRWETALRARANRSSSPIPVYRASPGPVPAGRVPAIAREPCRQLSESVRQRCSSTIGDRRRIPAGAVLWAGVLAARELAGTGGYAEAPVGQP